MGAEHQPPPLWLGAEQDAGSKGHRSAIREGTVWLPPPGPGTEQQENSWEVC